MARKSKGKVKDEDRPRVIIDAGPVILHAIRVEGFTKPTWRPLPLLTDAEAGKIVLPKLGVFEDKNRGGVLKHRSDGTGRLWQPASDFAFREGEAIKRYLADCQARGHVPSLGAFNANESVNGAVERIR
jgi:hypothetical protein